MGKQKSAAAAGAVAAGPVPRPPVLEHTTAELVSLIANLSEREDFTVDILGQAFALAQQRVGISVGAIDAKCRPLFSQELSGAKTHRLAL